MDCSISVRDDALCSIGGSSACDSLFADEEAFCIATGEEFIVELDDVFPGSGEESFLNESPGDSSPRARPKARRFAGTDAEDGGEWLSLAGSGGSALITVVSTTRVLTSSLRQERNIL